MSSWATKRPYTRSIAWYDSEIAALEQRVLEAATVEASQTFHARLDDLREKRAAARRDPEPVASAFRSSDQRRWKAIRDKARTAELGDRLASEDRDATLALRSVRPGVVDGCCACCGAPWPVPSADAAHWWRAHEGPVNSWQWHNIEAAIRGTEPVASADAAWRGLVENIDANMDPGSDEFALPGESSASFIARHRPAIEAAIRGTEAGLDVERVKAAFKSSGLMWVIPAKEFNTAAEVFAAEYARLARDE